MEEIANSCKIFIVKHKRKAETERQRPRYKYNIKMGLTKYSYDMTI
jgi:hypothetical protein